PLWWFAEYQQRRIGVLQLAPTGDGNELELLYMGLVQSARNQGFGRELARHAIRLAAEVGESRLHLSHDVRNHSAARVYTQLGFRETSRRAVWLKIFRESNHDSEPRGKSVSESS